MGIGEFITEMEALNAEKYLKTKFVRAMLGVRKVTQDNTPEKWDNVPTQDFSMQSDLDWNVTVNELDKELYHKYRLTDEDITFIETHVQSMGGV